MACAPVEHTTYPAWTGRLLALCAAIGCRTIAFRIPTALNRLCQTVLAHTELAELRLPFATP
jgi:hypothetical protein